MTFTPTTLLDWLNYLESLNPKRITLGLERIRTVAKRLDCLSFECPVITVAGTNGKGSTIALLAAMYQKAGYVVGCYTSPHLNDYRERIQINGVVVSSEILCDTFARIKQAAVGVDLTYFEFGTLAAFIIFQTSVLDLIILEVGLGGRLDAVNCVDPVLAVITSIGLDHCEYLGDTREQIAIEKAGILRSGVSAICGDVDPPVSLFKFVRSHAIPCKFRNQQFTVQQTNDTWVWRCGDVQLTKLPVSKLGIDNAATALAVVHTMQKQLPVSEQAIKSSLATTNLIGRWQRLNQPIATYVDVSHNPQAAHFLAERLARLPRKGQVFALCGMQAHKDILGTLKPLIPYVNHWIATEIATSTKAAAEQIQQYLQQLGVKDVTCIKAPEKAYQVVLKIAKQDDIIFIFGSFYIVAPFVTNCYA